MFTATFRDAFTGAEADRPEFNRMIEANLCNGVARFWWSPWTDWRATEPGIDL